MVLRPVVVLVDQDQRYVLGELGVESILKTRHIPLFLRLRDMLREVCVGHSLLNGLTAALQVSLATRHPVGRELRPAKFRLPNRVVHHAYPSFII